MGTGVLPLSPNDPGVKVTRGSRALVTADKRGRPSACEAFRRRGCGGQPVHRLAPYRLDREAAGEMDIETIEVFIGTGRRQRASTGPRP